MKGRDMNRRRQRCLFFVTLVATPAAVVLATAQTLPPAPGTTDSDAQKAASIPVLSGTWGHPSLGFEPPLSGPGPVRNTSRPNGVSNPHQFVGDYTNPILKPQAAQVVKKAGEMELNGALLPNPVNQCWPGGVPFVLWNFGMQLLQQAGKITFIYFYDHEFRQVRLNQPHPTRVTPSWFGDSVGHYEGDALVIDTIGIKIGPFAMVDFYGTPHTEALHVVERYRLLDYEAAKEALERDAKENSRINLAVSSGLTVDPDYKGKHLQLELTVQDEGVFTMPWSATITYRPASGGWPEYVCADNRHGHGPGQAAAAPTADKPDF
jgi:hypothetical protein